MNMNFFSIDFVKASWDLNKFPVNTHELYDQETEP